MKKLALLFLSLFLIISINSCSSDDSENPMGGTCDGLNVSFSADILPILTSTCATSISCHNGGGAQPALTNFNEIKPFADNGRLKVQVVDTRAMPQGTSLSQSQIDNFECWIADGAQDN